MKGKKLKEIVKNYKIKQQEFEYAGTDGVAEILGWQIVFFYKKNNLDSAVAMSFEEIDNIELIDIANLILKSIDIDIRFGDNIEKINQIYGKADFIDTLFEDIIRYSYIISTELFMVFGLKNGILSYLEIVIDKSMIKEIVSTRKSNII